MSKGGKDSSTGFPVVSFLEIDGRVLSGEELEEYCKDHGLCKRCARVRTHRRVVKLFGKGKKWEPMTLHDENTGEYSVYKGYCLQSTCYTLGQAKRLTGETGSNTRRESRRKKLKLRFKRKSDRNRPEKRRTRADPETGSVMSTMDDDMSILSGMSDLSGISTVSRTSGISAFSGIASSFRKRRKKRSSNLSMADSVSSFGDFSDDDTIDTTQTPMPMKPNVPGEINPVIAQRLEHLDNDYFAVLDLTKLELRPEDVVAVAQTLGKIKSLNSVILNKCKLRDEEMIKIGKGLELGNHMNIKSLSCRQNRIGNKGVQALEWLFRSSSALESIDLSENSISSKGAASILSSLNANENPALHTLNLSQNEIWDMDDGSFLRKNDTLKNFNLDGNFMHDEGAEQIAMAITDNKDCKLEKLYLGWNGISDDGATALAKMMETNSTLQVLGLAENDISNTGARAILSALAINTSVREISGLYHNQIDRKFIIVAIKRLLHRCEERTGQNITIDISPNESQNVEEEKTHTGDSGSEQSGDWGQQAYSDERHFDEKEAQEDEGPSIALEAIEHWDWGTFGIDYEGDSASEIPSNPIEKVTEPVMLETLPLDRLTIFQSAPLAYFDRDTAEHHAVPIFDFEYEVTAIADALSNKEEIGGDIELNVENVTAGRFKVSFLQGTSRIMHFSGHGQPNCVALENGFGYMQALPTSDLKKFVQNGEGKVDVVVLSSCHARSMANSFLEAGVPHVVCCQREPVFRDLGPIEFAKAFYQTLAKKQSLKTAFAAGLDAVMRSADVNLSGNMARQYCLLPEMPEDDPYHDVQVFYERPMPKITSLPEIYSPPLPLLPEQFVGREVDMYEVLESLRVDDVVRVGGAPGAGKASVVAAVARYILERPKSFKIDSIYWLPPAANSFPITDQLYADMFSALELIIESEDDIWDEEDFEIVKDRLTATLSEMRTILVIDGRKFTTEASGENLERLLTHLLNEVNLKIILLTAIEASQSSKTKTSRSEETIVNIGPLDLRASALLFGSLCPAVSSEGNPIVHTPEELADYLAPPSVVTSVDEKRKESRRYTQLLKMLGKGNPTAIGQIAADFTEIDLRNVLRYAKRPEVQVNSGDALEAAIAKWTSLKGKAIEGKNFARAEDISDTLEELESLRSLYPNYDNLAEKEMRYKEKFKEYLKAKKFNEANVMKRKILEVKKKMLHEKHSPTSNGKTELVEKAVVDITSMTERLKLNEASISEIDSSKTLSNDAQRAIMKITREVDMCSFEIKVGSVFDFSYTEGLSGLLFWSNELCDLSNSDIGSRILEAGGDSIKDELESLEIQATTDWGPVMCPTGEAVSLGPLSLATLPARFVFLAVGPLPPTNNDEEDWDFQEEENGLHILETELRASYRSAFQNIAMAGVEAVAISPLTSKVDGAMYERTLWVGVKTVIEEAKRTKLNTISLYASSGKEANLLIKMALGLGLQC